MSINPIFTQDDVSFHGFTEQEIRLSSLKGKLLSVRAEQCRERLWAEQGVALDRAEREVILAHPADNVTVGVPHHCIVSMCQHTPWWYHHGLCCHKL